MKDRQSIRFLDAANQDPELNKRIKAALERAALSSAEEIMKIASEAGYSFSRDDFEATVRTTMRERFAAGEIQLADAVSAGKKVPLESSCAKGCLSYTKSWHPSGFFAYDPLLD